MELPGALLSSSSKNKKTHSEKISYIFSQKKLFLYFQSQPLKFFLKKEFLSFFLKTLL